MNKFLLANFAAAFASLSAGVSIVATRFVIGETDPISLAFFRYFIGAMCLLPFLAIGLKRVRLPANHIPPLIVLGIILYAYFPWSFTASLKYTTAAYGAIALATMPIITLLIAWTMKREPLTGAKFLSVVLAFAGVVTAVSDSLFGDNPGGNHLLGISIMLTASLAASIYSVFAKPFLVAYGTTLITALSMTIGMIALSPLAYGEGALSGIPEFSPLGWAAVLFLGVIGGAVQFTSYTWALSWLAPTRVAIYLTLNPISAIFLAWPLLGEPITVEAIIGLMLVLSGIFLVNSARQKEAAG